MSGEAEARKSQEVQVLPGLHGETGSQNQNPKGGPMSEEGRAGVGSSFPGGVLPPTIGRGGGLHHTCLLAWHGGSRAADEEVELGAPAGIGANLVMLVKIDLSRVHHFPVQRQEAVEPAFHLWELWELRGRWNNLLSP